MEPAPPGRAESWERICQRILAMGCQIGWRARNGGETAGRPDPAERAPGGGQNDADGAPCAPLPRAIAAARQICFSERSSGFPTYMAGLSVRFPTYMAAVFRRTWPAFDEGECVSEWFRRSRARQSVGLSVDLRGRALRRHGRVDLGEVTFGDMGSSPGRGKRERSAREGGLRAGTGPKLRVPSAALICAPRRL